MSKKIIFPLIAVFTIGTAASVINGCAASADAHVGSTAPSAAPPPPPDPPPPPAPPPPADPPPPPPKPVKALGRAKIENGEIKIPGKVHFATDKATLGTDKETVEILQTVADVMKANEHVTLLRINGHTDNTGKEDHNQTLSQARADSVNDWLTKHGVDKSRLESKGWGSTQALVPNDNAADKEQNRRVEFKLWSVEGKPTDAAKAEAAGGGASATPAAATGSGGMTTGSGAPKGASTASGATPASTPPGKK